MTTNTDTQAHGGGVERGIYIASKTTHGARWRALRASGVPIISTWIDEAEAGATSNWPDLWHRCVREARQAAATIVYREQGEVLKGAFVEMGAALAAGRPVFAVGCDEFSVRHHMRVVPCASFEEALHLAREALAASPAAPAPAAGVDGRPNGWTEALAVSFMADNGHNPEMGMFAKSFSEGAWSEIQGEWPEFVEFAERRLRAAPDAKGER